MIGEWDGWITYEDKEIYDGWILRFNEKTKKIEWRDFWITQRMSPVQKQKIEQKVKKLITQ